MSSIASLGAVPRFNRIDINADSLVSEAEFVSARPKGVSEDQAKSLFGKLDTAQSGALSQQQLEDGLKAQRPGGNLSTATLSAVLEEVQKQDKGNAKGPPPAGGKDETSSEEENDPADTNRDGTVSPQEKLAYELKQAEEKLQEARRAEQGNLAEYSAAIRSYANAGALAQGVGVSPITTPAA